MSEQVKRSEVKEILTWDLSKIFKNDEEQEKAVSNLLIKIEVLKSFSGKLTSSAKTLYEGLALSESLEREIESAYMYAHLKSDQDTSDNKYQAMYAKTFNLYVKFSELTASFTPEILMLSEEQLKAYLKEEPQLQPYQHMFERIFSRKNHTLSPSEESLLAGAGEIFDASSSIASTLTNADLKFKEVKTEDGSMKKMTNGLYAQLLESTHRELREGAYKMMYETFGSVLNTLGSTLSTTVKVHNYNARIRKYASARQAALSANFVPEPVFDTLVDVVNKNLPVFHEYLQLRKDILGVDSLRMYDVYTPLVGEAPIKFTIEEAKEITLKALAPLGEEYVSLLKRAFDERWIDWIENEGKRSGAYSSGGYDTCPYILMNWHDSLDQLYTLVHELGHSMHSYYSTTTQSFTYSGYPIFLAEIASTTNENLLTEYLLKTQKDPRVIQYVLNHYLDGVKGTVFRQTQFAQFEHFMHEEDAKGTPLTPDFLSKAYRELNAKYYANVEQDDEIAKEWSRIPHFYYNYYVFQYATGFSAASALARKILNNEPNAVENYFSFLKAGSSDYPIEVMKKAGVDMTKADYIEDTMKMFKERLEQFKALRKS